MLNLTPEQINQIFPVIGLVHYPGGVIVRRGCSLNLSQVRYLHKRGKILMVTRRSMNKLALLVKSTEVRFLSVMTLTYGANYPLDGKMVKRHLNHFLITAKRHYGDFEYVWIIEFQERGAPHFHICTTLKPPVFDELWRFAQIWAGISVPFIGFYSGLNLDRGRLFNSGLINTHNASINVHSHPKSWEALRKSDGFGRYMAKYANKLRQKEVPEIYSNIGRFWGASRGVKLPEGTYYHGGNEQVKQFLEVNGRDLKSWRVLPRIILVG